jgi:hypothetical protein
LSVVASLRLLGPTFNSAIRPTSALPSLLTVALVTSSLDHLVGAREQRDWRVEAQRLGSLEIDDQLEFGGLLDRQIARLFASEGKRLPSCCRN